MTAWPAESSPVSGTLNSGGWLRPASLGPSLAMSVGIGEQFWVTAGSGST